VANRRASLTLEDREDISRGLAKGLENKDIAISIGRDESVVSREIARHGGREAYRAWKADAAARESRTRPKERKIDADPELCKRVTGDLLKGWSPEEIAGRLRYEAFRGETDMSVSHEAVATPARSEPVRTRAHRASRAPLTNKGNGHENQKQTPARSVTRLARPLNDRG